MRITCPNCNAQYEVGDDMIPSDGREVQCSNCGTTWFQSGRPRAPSAVEERAVRRPGHKASPVREDEPGEDAADRVDDDIDDEDEEAQPYAVRHGAKPRRPEPDKETLDILREEREREERLREAGGAVDGTGKAGEDTEADDAGTDDAETNASESRPEAVPEHRAQAATERARMAAAASLARARGSDQRKRGAPTGRTPEPAQDDDIDMSDVIAETLREASASQVEEDDPDDDITGGDAAAASDAAPSSNKSARRELLPDIEEINSSLRPDERAADAEALAGVEDEDEEVARRSSGFRIGFMVMCVIIIALLIVYLFAAQISEAVPQLAAILTEYVAWIDTQRVALAAAAEALTDRITRDN